jgi:hypothetical protein
MDRSAAHLTLLGLGLASLTALDATTARAEDASFTDASVSADASEAAPSAAPEHSSVHVVGHERVAALLNPMGAEHRLDLSVRGEVGDQDDLFFDGAHWQLGATSFVSPVYAIGGGFLELAPFSFLVLKGEVMGMTVWPIGMDGAGHYAVSGYGADVHSANLPADAAGSASGFTAGGNGTLQGAIDLDAHVRIIAADEVGLYYVRSAPRLTTPRCATTSCSRARTSCSPTTPSSRWRSAQRAISWCARARTRTCATCRPRATSATRWGRS